MKKTNLVYILALLAILFWGTTAAVTKLMLISLPPMENLCIASAIASVILLVLNAVQGNLKKLKALKPKDYLIICGLGFIGIFLYTALYNYGLKVMTASEASVINYLWPIMIAVFSVPILHEKMTATTFIALLLSFAGIVIMVTKLDFSGFNIKQLPGILACFCAAVLYGLFSVLNKKYAYDQGIVMLICYILTTVFSAVLSILTEEFRMPEGTVNIVGLLWLGVFGYAFGYLFWNLALTKGNTAKISNLAYLTPFLTLVFARIILGENISVFAVIGLLFIVAGIVLQSKFRKT